MSYKTVKLGSVCKFLNGGTPSKHNSSYFEGNIAWITGADITSPVVTESRSFITEQAIQDSATNLIQEGTVLLVTRTSVGKVAVAGIPLCFSQDITAVLPDEKIINPKFLVRLLQSRENYFKQYQRGATIQGITREVVSNAEIPLPPLAEQKRIAEVLDKADALREKRRRALQKLDTLLQSVFLEMFGDPVKNPKGWKKGKLGDVIYSAKDGPHVSPEYVEDGIPFLSTRHIKPGKVVWEDLKYISSEDAQIHWKKCKPEKGDILYTKGGTTGIAAMVDFEKEVAVWVHVALLKTNHKVTNALWLENMLNSNYCYVQSQRYTHGIANRDLGLKRMVNIEIYIPPLEEQKSFSDFAIKLKEIEKKNIKAFEDSENLFQSLQQKAFKGELFENKSEVESTNGKKVWQQTSLF